MANSSLTSSSKVEVHCKHSIVGIGRQHGLFSQHLPTFTAETLDHGIPALEASFTNRFKATFPVPDTYSTSNRKDLESFSQAITSNLFGGIGYFYGTSIVDEGFAHEWDQEDEYSYDEDDEPATKQGPRLTEPAALLTATPSRSFFPRGFYWYGYSLCKLCVLTIEKGRRVSLTPDWRVG